MRAHDFLPEKINPKVADPDFHAEKTVQTRAGEMRLVAKALPGSSHSVPQFVVNAYDSQGQDVGRVRFVVADFDREPPRKWFGLVRMYPERDPYIVAGYATVRQDLQRQGIGTAIYDFVKELGNDIRPSTSQSDAARAMWRSFDRREIAEVIDSLTEYKVPSVLDQIRSDVRKHGPGDYFVRFTDTDKLGFSDRQWFGQTPDIGDPEFDIDQIGANRGRRVLWFYPLEYYLDADKRTYGMQSPYAWLVKLKPNAWLQTVRRGDTQKQQAPAGKQRVGILRMTDPPAALFFQPGFEVVGRYYDYAGQHQRHGEVKGKPKPTFFDRVRGDR